jgi:hypothetical protein
MLKAVIDELREKGVAVESDGATCVFVEGKEVPLIVQKSDGGYGYASTDMACIKQRVYDEKADWVVYVTDVGQAEHFAMVFAAARRAGWLPEDDKGLDVSPGHPPPAPGGRGGRARPRDGAALQGRAFFWVPLPGCGTPRGASAAGACFETRPLPAAHPTLPRRFPPRAPQPPRVSHVGFGLVLGEDGKKFKTRSGDVVRLVELLDEAKARCRDTIKARREEVRGPGGGGGCGGARGGAPRPRRAGWRSHTTTPPRHALPGGGSGALLGSGPALDPRRRHALTTVPPPALPPPPLPPARRASPSTRTSWRPAPAPWATAPSSTPTSRTAA